MRFSRHRDQNWALFLRRVLRIGLFLAFSFVAQPLWAQNVICDLSVDTSNYYCRGWRDDVGPEGGRVRFIARMMGEDYEDDFGREFTSLGDINGDGRGDFMVWIPGKCEWRIYYGDTLIAREPVMTWPRCTPASTGSFKLLPDISGDGEPDLLRTGRAGLHIGELYFAGAAFDTICDLVFSEPEFVGIGNGDFSTAGGSDINGDGEPDLVIGDANYLDLVNRRAGRVYVFWGGGALDSIPDLVFTDTFWTGQDQLQPIGGVLALLPSLNDDSYADLVFGRPTINLVEKNPPGEVQIHFGGPDMDTVPDLILLSPDTAWSPVYGYLITNYFGWPVNIGDCNLDGYDDLLVAGSQIVPSYIYFGGPDFDTIVDLRLTEPWPTEGGTGTRFTPLGDVNGDGAPDFCTVMETDANLILPGHVSIHFAREQIDGTVDWSLEDRDWLYISAFFGRGTKSLGDVDGDGIDDIGVGGFSSTPDYWNKGTIYIFAGAAVDTPTGIFDDPGGAEDAALVPRLILFAAPNPFNSSTTIHLADHFRSGTLAIYDILGRPVRSLAEGIMPESHSITWDARDTQGRTLASGLYFLRAENQVYHQTLKIILLK